MSAPLPPSFYDDLDGTSAEAWGLLTRGAVDRRSAFHTPAVVTNGVDGAPAVRTVVLRAVDITARTLRFHTDKRSSKFTELSRDPRIGLHVYDAHAKIQLRLAGRARLHPSGDPVAERAWEGSQRLSRLCYGQRTAPGADVEHPAEALAGTEDAEGGYVNFVAVVVTVDRLEWLYLASAGHRRARFDWTDTSWQGRWLAP